MNFKSIKTAADLPVKGIELIKEDGKIIGIIVGGKVRVQANDTYSKELKLTVPQPYEEQERHRVTMKHPIFGEKVTFYDSSFDAGQAEREFERAGAEAVTDKVKVNVDDAGNVVGVIGEAVADPVLEDVVPF